MGHLLRNWTLETSARLVFIAFMAPFFVYAVTATAKGDMPYRVLNLAHTGALVVTAYLIARKEGLKLSPVAKGFALFLIIDAAGVILSSFVEYRPDVVPITLLQTTIIFLAILLSFDVLGRKYSFEEFCGYASPIAIVLLAVSCYHLQFQAAREWGRAYYFGLHPNTGGEIIFGAIAIAAFNKRISLRWIAYALGMWALMQVQARASEIAAAAIIAGCELPRTSRGFEQAFVAGLIALSVLCLGLLLDPALMDGAVHFVQEDMLKTHDQYRGEGTKLVGRADTWIMAWQKMAQYPVFGTGVNQSGMTSMLIPIHNGYIKNMAEFGLIGGVLINGFLAWSAVMALLKDWRRGIVIVACGIQFFFNARNINLLIFPLLLWIATMEWKAPAVAVRVAKFRHVPAQAGAALGIARRRRASRPLAG